MKELIALGVGNVTITGAPQMPTGGVDTIFAIIGNLISLLLVIVAVASLFSIIFSGIQWTTSGGDEKNIEKARGRLKYSLIGLIVALLSFFIIQFIGSFFGISTPFPNNRSSVFVACSDENPPPNGACANPEFSCIKVNGHWGCHHD